MTTPAGKRKRKAKQLHIDEELDDALEHTFPASDPIAVGGTTATEPPLRSADHKPPEIDLDEVEAQKRRKPKGQAS